MLAFEKSIGAVIFRREGEKTKFLLLNHGNDYWNFPKGHPEAGEIDEETLRRETKEEAGIQDLKIYPNFYETSRYFYRASGQEKQERLAAGKKLNVFKTVIFYLAQTEQSEITLSPEHTEFEWLEYSEALKRLRYKNSRKLLTFAWEKIKKEYC